MLPSVTNGYSQDEMCDYGAVTSVNSFLRDGAYSAETSSGWTWTDLRNINYFIENCANGKVSDKVRNNYIGLARFFRAYFYLGKVQRFGDVPWTDKVLSNTDDKLYAERDSRDVVMNHVLDDINYACENITRTSDATLLKHTAYIALARAYASCYCYSHCCSIR